MKPEKDCSNDADEMDEEKDPREVLLELGMLVVEARTPHLSAKGRIEGPHCPTAVCRPIHRCSRDRFECQRADHFVHQMELLWRNSIPSCIDVLLYPNCQHGEEQAVAFDSAGVSATEECLLLERWTIQIFQKRHVNKLDGSVGASVLQQAVRSYLHFSQMSSWLLSTGGSLPVLVIYRLYAPGENIGVKFNQTPDQHKFPTANLKNFGVKVEVSSLPRQDQIVVLTCPQELDAYLGATASKTKPTEENTTSDGFSELYHRGRSMKRTRQNNSRAARKRDGQKGEKKVNDKVNDSFNDKVSDKVNEKFTEKFTDKVGDKFNAKVSDKFNAKVSDKFNAKVSDKFNVKVSDKFNVKVSDKFNVKVSDKVMGGVKSASDIFQDVPTTMSSIGEVSSSCKVRHSRDKSSSSDELVDLHDSLPKFSLNCKPHRRSPEELDAISPIATYDQSMCYLDKGLSKVNYEQSLYYGENSNSKINDQPNSYGEKSNSKIYHQSLCYAETGYSKLYDQSKCYRDEGHSKGHLKASYDQSKRFVEKTNLRGESKSNYEQLCYPEIDLSPKSYKCGANSPSRQIFKQKLLPLKPQTLQDVGDSLLPLSTSKKLHSPKVLMTTNSKPDTSYAKRKCLDLNESADSDDWEKKFISTKIEDLTSPLSPEDIHAYLTNLRTISPRLDNLSSDTDTDSPKCKFFIGETPKIGKKKSYLREQSLEDNVSVNLFNSRLSDTSVTNSRLVVQKTVSSVEKDLIETSHLLGSLNITTNPEPRDDDRQSLSLDLASSLNNVFHNEAETEVSSCAAAVQNGSARQRLLDRENYQFPSETISQTNRSKSVPEDMGCEESGYNKSMPSKRKLPTTPTMDDIVSFRRHMTKSSSMLFNQRTGLPSQSSPAPVKRKSMSRFEYDSSLTNARAIKNALSCSKLVITSYDQNEEQSTEDTGRVLSNSAPASTNCLLGNFEESMLNGRLEPIGAVDGFTVEIGASGSFCPKHMILPVTSYFFKLSDDNAPSPYLGHVDLESLGKKGYHIPKRGTVQVTLFNPNKTVVKMFVVMYNLTDMPSNCQTFLRQRTMYMPVDSNSSEPSYLRYLIHLRLATSKSGKIHLHTDIRLIFARDKFEFDNKVAQYELRSFTEGPQNPKFSPKR